MKCQLFLISFVALFLNEFVGPGVCVRGEDRPSLSEPPTAYRIPQGDERIKASLYQASQNPTADGGEPIRLSEGPQLFIDDHLILRSRNIERRVNRPQRDPNIPNPIVTGKEDWNCQPFMTVIRDPQTKRFRIWYNVHSESRKGTSTHLGTMESDDGVHWNRPFRVLDDPAPIRYGASVIDEGPDFRDPSQRYKFGWWKDGGLKIAASSDGLQWTPLVSQPVIHHTHDINNIFRDTLRNRYIATVPVFTTGSTWEGQRRVTMQSVSDDLLHWEKPWYVLTADDSQDEGQTQFYAMSGHLIRGDLLIAMVKVLRDDKNATGISNHSYGMGYTTLAWTRDGEHWIRDRTPFFEPNPQEGTWDHSHAWLGHQVPVLDEVFLYYAGYKNGHKANRYEERQLGLVRMQRDRYVSRDAGRSGGSILTPPVILTANNMTVNAEVSGELQVRLLDLDGQPLPGFDTDDCETIEGDSLAHPVRWKASLSTLVDKPVQIEFLLWDAKLFGFE